MKLELIPNWRRAPRMVSMWAMSIAGAVQTTWEFIPPDMKSSVDPRVVYGLTMALLIFGFVGRLVAQRKVHE